ncbi:MAG: phosphohydrolase [Ferruginibacter sp.]
MQSNQPMKEFVMNLLKSKLPLSYHYHEPAHTLYVQDKTIEIATQENCTPKEIALLSVAALWHDTGFINIYKGHEEESCKLAMQYLPGYGYSADDIQTICGMIMATKLPQSPKNKLEEIIADADLEYLGAKDADIMAEKLFSELQSLNPALTREKWNRQQISFIKNHHYFTRFCREYRESVKSAYLKKLQDKV